MREEQLVAERIASEQTAKLIAGRGRLAWLVWLLHIVSLRAVALCAPKFNLINTSNL